MARTLKKTEMEDLLGFTTPLALSELGFFSTLGTPEIEDSLFDDVYRELVGKDSTDDAGLAPETISAGELLDELELKGGDGLGEAGWMTDKINFTGLDTSILAMETKDLTELDSNLKLDTIDSSVGEFIFSVSQENFELSDVLVTSNPTSPASPEQKVPDFAPLSPVSSVLSPMSVATDDSGISFVSLDDDVTAELLLQCGTAALPVDQTTESFTSDSSATNSLKVESKLSCSVTGARITQTPYSKNKTTLYTVKPKVKTPHQRMRKREQNKDAATRYRVKKRDEQDKIATECEDLEKVNRQLKDQVGSLTKEIDYLKNLMLEVYKTRLQKQQL